MIPTGIMIDSGSVLVGGVLGAAMGKLVPQRVCTALSLIFGVCSMAMGVSYIVKMQALPAVVMAVILGVVVGELLYLEQGIAIGVGKIRRPVEKLMRSGPSRCGKEEFMEKFISITVIACASGTGIFGAMEYGMTGDYTILITKSILDFFTALTFAITLGPLVAGICVPQMIILTLLYAGASFIYPATDELMRADFTACGGILMLATGLRVSGIKSFPIANMIPAMILVMPLSWLWTEWLIPLLT